MQWTDDEIREKIKSDILFGGATNGVMLELSEKALALAPTDPLVLMRYFRCWNSAAYPSEAGDAQLNASSFSTRMPSEKPPSAADHRRTLESAVHSAEAILAANANRDTREMRALAFWVPHMRAMLPLTRETAPTAEELATSNKIASDAYDGFVDYQKRFPDECDNSMAWFRWSAVVRRRAFEVAAAGVTTESEVRTKLVENLRSSPHVTIGWQLEPLLSASAQREMRAIIDERSAAKAHLTPVNNGRVDLEIFGWRQAVPEEEAERRLLLVLWALGVDQLRFMQLLTHAIGHKYNGCIDVLLSLRFDIAWVAEEDTSFKNLQRGWAGLHKGQTLLYWAVEADNAYAVRALLAQGAPPNVKNATTPKQSPLQLANSRNKPSVLKAFAEVAPSTSSKPAKKPAKVAKPAKKKPSKPAKKVATKKAARRR